MVGERFSNGFRRSAVDLQAGAIPKANALIATVHHNKVHRPRPDGIDLRYKNPLATPASVLATCLKNHFSILHISGKKSQQPPGIRPRPLRTR
jgi:hypothetical protein